MSSFASNPEKRKENESEEADLPALSASTMNSLQAFLKDSLGDNVNVEDFLKESKKRMDSRSDDSHNENVEYDVFGNRIEDSDEEDEKEVDIEKIIKFDTYERTCYNKDAIKAAEDTSSQNLSQQPDVLRLALLNTHHSLWAEYIYNAARVLSDKIDGGFIDCRKKTCLELGAGAGLPGLLAALNGASVSVISDYGRDNDLDLIRVIDYNIELLREAIPVGCKVVGSPFIWGYPVDPLTKHCDCEGRKFDLMFLADCIFNRSEHRKLLHTVQNSLEPDGLAWVTFSHHDPQKKALDLKFFSLASEEFGLEVDYVTEEIRRSYPFVESDGMDEARGVVYTYTLKLAQK